MTSVEPIKHKTTPTAPEKFKPSPSHSHDNIAETTTLTAPRGVTRIAGEKAKIKLNYIVDTVGNEIAHLAACQ